MLLALMLSSVVNPSKQLFAVSARFHALSFVRFKLIGSVEVNIAAFTSEKLQKC